MESKKALIYRWQFHPSRLLVSLLYGNMATWDGLYFRTSRHQWAKLLKVAPVRVEGYFKLLQQASFLEEVHIEGDLVLGKLRVPPIFSLKN